MWNAPGPKLPNVSRIVQIILAAWRQLRSPDSLRLLCWRSWDDDDDDDGDDDGDGCKLGARVGAS